MLDIAQKLQDVARQKAKWDGLIRNAKAGTPAARPRRSALVETATFGANPGALRMLSHVPANLPANAPLVVVLHGCSQNAAGYDHGTGWTALADRHGFAVLFPEQRPANNPNVCFNWFLPADTRRGQGEAASIHAMIETMVANHRLDRDRIFITGLSAGGAMASAMLANYPETFAAGAIIAGLPYGAARNVQEAFAAMFQSPARPARDWGDLVRAASSHAGAWPRISVWHGDADQTVVPANAGEIVKQWRDVHGLDPSPTLTDRVNGQRHDVWRDADGNDLIESYTIAGMAHGAPLAVGDADDQGGNAGPFLPDVGISSTFRAAAFFGIVPRKAAPAMAQHAPSNSISAPRRRALPKPIAGIDVNAIITRALTAAGLMKR